MLRIIDIGLALLGVILLAPLLLAILLVTWVDTGSPLYFQIRLGRNREPFVLVKFRSMRVGTASMLSHRVDPSAVTRTGKLLRRTKLDELPQLWSVLKGDMSLVGPRPGLPEHSELTEARNRLGVFTARPGITGLAQLRGIDMSDPNLLAKVDAEMLAGLSVYSYLRIILDTALGKGYGDRVK